MWITDLFCNFLVPNSAWKAVTLSWASITVILLVLHRRYTVKEMMEVHVIKEGQYYNEDIDWFHGGERERPEFIICMTCCPESPLCLQDQRKWMDPFIRFLWKRNLGLSIVSNLGIYFYHHSALHADSSNDLYSHHLHSQPVSTCSQSPFP